MLANTLSVPLSRPRPLAGHATGSEGSDENRSNNAPAKQPTRAGRVPGNQGIWVGICCEYVEFLVLFTVYFVARAHFPEAFQTGSERLSLTAGILITVLMVSSSFFIAAAVTSLRAGRRRLSIVSLVIGLVLALGYPVAKYFEVQWNLAHGVNGQSGIFFTVYYYLTFTHVMHVFWGTLGILWVLARHGFGIYTAEEHGGLEALACYWHATDTIWLIIFPLCYVLS